MGKNLRQKVTCSPIQNHPGFMWGLFDILKRNHWRYIKKRLPYKRPACRRNPAVGTKNEVNNTIPSPDRVSTSSKSKVEDKTNLETAQRPKKTIKSKESCISGEKTKTKTETKKQNDNNNSEEKSSSNKLNSEERSRKTHSEIKKAVKALIKALVIEDKSKRKKNRHHRSSTYPVAQQSNNTKEKKKKKKKEKKKDSSSSSLSEIEEETSDKNSSKGNDRIRASINISPAIGSLNPLYLMSEVSSYNSDWEEINNNNILDSDDNKSEDSKNIIEEEEEEEEVWFDPKLKNSKEVSENEDDDDSSPRRSKACLDALNLIHMNRNFLLKVLQDPGSPLARHFQSQQSFSSKTMTKAGSFPSRGSSHSGFDPVGDIDNKPISLKPVEDSSGYTRKRGENQVVIKRFKDLRQKIKHVINENKNEKHRITMDAVLDKVPRKYGFSKDLRHDIFAHLKGKKNNKGEGGGEMKQIRRTSSLCGSLDRYLQLYECSFQREANNNSNNKTESEESSSPSKKVPKFLGRILSSPEMKSPYAWKIDDTSGLFITSNRSIEQEQDGLEDITEISEDQSQSSEQETLETEQNREIDEAEVETRSLKDSAEDIDEFDISQENVSKSKQLDEELLNIEAQDKPKFNYVRDILEISGFNAPESLSMWQSDYQPLDPLIYEDVNSSKGGCMFQDPECSRNEEEGGNCNHMLLFDLINEVLIEIYERSYHYCPKPLSSLCKIHPMPLGYSVLKEVWVRISCYLRYKPYDEVEEEQSFDKIMSRDLLRDDSWMDLQFESECVGIEVEDLIFEELLEELIVSV